MVWFVVALAAATVRTLVWLAPRTPTGKSRRRRADALATRYSQLQATEIVSTSPRWPVVA